MGDYAIPSPVRIFEGILGILRRCFFCILSFGPMPTHVAFIMDGNRRFTRKHRMESGAGHRAGFLALMSALQYCYEMGINYVTVYAFSIDNFRRKPEEVETVMDLMLEKIEELLKEESLVTKYSVRINFWGNLHLLTEPVRLAVEKAMAVTARNSGPTLSVCVAYTSTDEITHAVQESCKERLNSAAKGCLDGCDVGYGACSGVLSVKDAEKYLYTAGCPDPDIVIRTSGETRLEQFSPLADYSQPLAESLCPMARILSEALGLGNIRIPKSTAVFGEGKKVFSLDTVTQKSWDYHRICVRLSHKLFRHNLA